jgi:hypothetical protein
LRERDTSSSKAARNSAKPSFPAALMFGTSSVREPSFFCTSTATPSRTSSRWIRCGLPSSSAYASFMRGKVSSARRIAQATRCVKLTLLWPADSRLLLSRRRFSSSVRTGSVRTEVAVGIARLASMFSTMRTAPPRIGCRMSPGRIAGSATAFERSFVATPCGSWRTSVCSGAFSGPALGSAGLAGSWTITVTGADGPSVGRPVALSK